MHFMIELFKCTFKVHKASGLLKFSFKWTFGKMQVIYFKMCGFSHSALFPVAEATWEYGVEVFTIYSKVFRDFGLRINFKLTNEKK
jgi:hypothetical protein